MKRQPKPFAIEIKRSRRSPAAPAGAPEPDAGAAGEASVSPQFITRSPESDLVIPAFLQSAKDVRRPSTKERSDVSATDRDKVFAPAPQVEQDQTGTRIQARVLPSLIPPQTFDQDDRQKKSRQPRPERVAADNPAVKKARSTRKPDASASSAAGEASNGRKAPLASPSATPEPKVDDVGRPPQLTRSRMFLHLRRIDAATLPLGQRWKRRLHPRAW